jgi:hypothetical protein
MGISCFWCGVLLYLAPFLTPFPLVTAQQSGVYLTVNSSTSWTNTLSAPDSVKFDDGSFARIILSVYHPIYPMDMLVVVASSIIKRTTVLSLPFSLFITWSSGNISKSFPLEVVWSANPNNPVSINATLQLTSERGWC